MPPHTAFGRSLRGALFGLWALGCQASPPTPAVDTAAPTAPPPSAVTRPPSPLFVGLDFCDDVVTVDGGRLCAVQPSRLDPDTRDFLFNQNNPGVGFGYHAIGVPDDWNSLRGVWIHFTGSYGWPYRPQDGVFVSEVWLTELVRQGFLVIQPGYANHRSVNGDLCAPSTDGFQVDDCAGKARREILWGEDQFPHLAVAPADGVLYRLEALSTWLEGQGLALPPGFTGGALDWSALRVSGHSQGAGHAWYLAKNEGVHFGCFLGGPYDRPDGVSDGPPAAIADWYLEPGQATGPAALGAFVVTSDPNYAQFVAAYGVMGLEEGVQWFDAEDTFLDAQGQPMDGHAAAIGSPQLAAERGTACFREPGSG